MIDVIQYACTACGNCCKGSIHLTIAEAIRFGSKFPIALHAVRQVPKEQLAKDHWEYLKPLSHLMPVNGGETQRILTSLVTVSGPSAACRQLDETMRCSLHEQKKPGYCEAYPFDPFVPWRLQGQIWGGRSHICPDEAKPPEAPIIFNAGRFQPPPPKLLAALYAEMRRDKAVRVKAFRMAYAQVLAREGPIVAQAIVIPLNKGDGPSRFIGIDWVVTALLWTKEIDVPTALAFLEQQIQQNDLEPLAARHVEGLKACHSSLLDGSFEERTKPLWEVARLAA